jgi:hypothetical protein
MSTLAKSLQHQFSEHCPAGWRCHREGPVLSPELERHMGYAPRADVLLERTAGNRRLWIEFEVSRADPVANHAEFATSHLFQPQLDGDVFVAMVSAHVSRGRRILVAHTILLMRHLGMSAFETVLLPHLTGEAIKHLNHLEIGSLASQQLSVVEEIERALAVSEPIGQAAGHRIFYAGDWLDVWTNVFRWNNSLLVDEMRLIWGQRTIKYFIFDPGTELFAPSKICAFLQVPASGLKANRVGEEAGRWSAGSSLAMGMTVPFYVQLDERETRFYGAIARHHLITRLAMRLCTPGDGPEVAQCFSEWISRWDSCVRVHPQRPVFLLPPEGAPR